MRPEAIVPATGRDGSAHLLDYHHDVRRRDAYLAYAVLPGRPGRVTDGAADSGRLRIVQENDAGVVLRGVKALATAAVLADEVWIGNLQPMVGKADAEAVTCVVPCAALKTIASTSSPSTPPLHFDTRGNTSRRLALMHWSSSRSD